MSSINILDASAILAIMLREKGHESLGPIVETGNCLVTTVNYCEVLSKLSEHGMPTGEALSAFEELQATLIDFDADLALRAAALRVRTRTIGASIGDRACLALAEKTAESAVTPIVYTSDHSWSKLKWGFRVVNIRAGKNPG